jgi:hypothetical protein
MFYNASLCSVAVHLFIQCGINFFFFPAVPPPFFLAHAFFRTCAAYRLPVIVVQCYKARFRFFKTPAARHQTFSFTRMNEQNTTIIECLKAAILMDESPNMIKIQKYVAQADALLQTLDQEAWDETSESYNGMKPLGL